MLFRVEMTPFLTCRPHNPNFLTPEQYGAGEGYRLLYEGEQFVHVEAHTPNGTHWFETRLTSPLQPKDCSSYRTRDPDPWAEPWLPGYFLNQLNILKDDFRRIQSCDACDHRRISEICEHAIGTIQKLMPSQPL